MPGCLLSPEIVKLMGIKGEVAIAKYIGEAKAALKIKGLKTLPEKDRVAVLQWLKTMYCSEALKFKNVYQYEVNNIIRQICTKGKGVYYARESLNGGKKYCAWFETAIPEIIMVNSDLYISNHTGDNLLINTGGGTLPLNINSA